ncbi:MAG: hypothetical protein M3357_02980 [Actinomycetota bacterium]|jgi:hypothetical protein|nr:hypothetical protein [Actinomycetota bacterium]
MQHLRHHRVPLAFSVVLVAWTIGAFGTGGTGSPAGANARHAELLMGTGVGMYTDASVANQVSSFTINPKTVSCGVGTVAAGGDASGPFAMLMYATRMDSYTVDQASGEIRATGRMRSITKIGTQTVEDAEHDFLAVAAATVAHGGFEQAAHAGGDRFDVHFSTPFWDRYNVMCTPSSLVSGACRFGGELLLGHVFIPH